MELEDGVQIIQSIMQFLSLDARNHLRDALVRQVDPPIVTVVIEIAPSNSGYRITIGDILDYDAVDHHYHNRRIS